MILLLSLIRDTYYTQHTPTHAQRDTHREREGTSKVNNGRLLEICISKYFDYLVFYLDHLYVDMNMKL